MSIRKNLSDFGAWLGRETQCAPDEPFTQTTSPTAGASFSQFLGLHAPGGLDTSRSIDAERAPLLLSFKRHRRIPVNWLAVVEGRNIDTDWGDEALRRRIETIWLYEAGVAHKIPEPAIVHADLGQHKVRIFYPDGLAKGHLFNEGKIPDGSVLVQENPARHAAPKLYALKPKAGKELAAGSPWLDVEEVLEVFPKDQTQQRWVESIADALVKSLKGSSVEWPIEPSAISVLSSRMGPLAFSSRLTLEWRNELIEDMLAAQVVRTAAPGAGVPGAEAYWTLNEERRASRLKEAHQGLGTLLLDPATLERPVLDQFTAQGEWIIKAGNRRYMVQFRPELSPDDKANLNLQDPAGYDDAWKKHVRGLIPIAWAMDPNAQVPDFYPFGYMHSVDLAPQLITEEFAKLKAAYDVAVASNTLGDAILASFPSMIERDPDYIRAQANHARELKSQTYLPRSRILTLKQRAAKLGYQLATGFQFNGLADNQILRPTGPDQTVTETVEIGRLYTAEERIATYTVKQSEYVTKWGISPLNPFGSGDILPGVSLPGLADLGGLISGLGIISGGGLGGLSLPGLPFGGLPVPGLPGLGFGPKRHRRDYPVTVSVNYTGLREVNVDMEPWEAFRQELQRASFHCLMAETGEQGYVVEGGVPLREILSRCLVDEDYRQKLAIFVPIYQQSFDQELVKVRYVVAIRPEAGYEPLGFPSIFCEEDLSYKAEWRGTEIGELLHSISLAPGEHRDVTITRTVDRKTEQIDSITTVLDITKTDKLDLESSLEETLSREQNRKDTSNWNVNASAKIGWFEGGGGGGGSQEKTVRDFAETIKKSAMKSTREMRVNQKQEVKSSTTATTAVNTIESTKATFSNINQGRTLNIQFHKVNNIFKAGLVVENLRLSYVPSTELIQGLGIHDVLTFSLRDLSSLLACANNDVALTGGDFLYDLPTLERRILRTVVRTILRDYVEDDDVEPVVVDEGHDGENLSAARSEMAGLVASLLREGARAFGLPPEAKQPLETVVGFLEDSLKHTDTSIGVGQYLSALDECQHYVAVLTKLYKKGQVIDPHTLTVPSTATYADAQVGQSPSTEPYSERMREAEITLKYADIESRRAESDARRSLAGLPASSRRSTLNAQLDRQTGGRMRIEVYPPLEAGEWTLLCDGKLMGRAQLMHPTGSIEIAPSIGTEWRRDGGHHWVLVSPDRYERIGLPIY